MVTARGVPHFDCPLCLDPCVQRMGPKQFLVKPIDGHCHDIGFTDARGVHWIAPVGLQTDGGSIPWIAEPLAGEAIDSDALPAYLLHDQAYQLAPGHESGIYAANQSWERAAADQMLYEACVAAGLPRWQASLIYHNVRLFGWKAWRGHAQANATK